MTKPLPLGLRALSPLVVLCCAHMHLGGAYEA